MTLPNGKTGEMLRWVFGLVLAAVVAYFTSTGALQAQLAVITERENNHYSELLKRLDRIENKLDAEGYGLGK